MIRGTTPLNTFTCDIDLSGAELIYITYSQKGRVIIEKSIQDITVEENILTTRLSQGDTLKFSDREPVSIQIRAKFPSSNAVACAIINTTVTEILKDGEI